MNRARISTLLRSRMTANYLFYSLDYGLRIVVQLGYFAIISRSLGAAGYGIFASISAVSILFAVFSGLGSEQVLVRRAAGDRSAFPAAFGHTLICMAGSVIPVAALCFLALQFMNTGGIDWWAVILFIMSEALFTKLTYLANTAYMAHEIAGRQFVINITTSTIKLIGAFLAWTFSHPLTLDAWAVWYFASTGVGAAFAIMLVVRELGAPHFIFYREDIRDGLQYGLEFSSVVALRDLDKPLVVETLGAEAGGLYTAAFRIVDSACIPVRALLLATYTRYFSHAKVDTRAAVAFGYKVLPLGLAISAVLAICLFAFAWVIPLIIGPSFDGTVPIIKWLAVYPAIILLSGAGMDLLRSVGMLGSRLWITVFSIVTYLPLCWVGAIYGGVIGVTVARNVSQLLLAAATWFTIFRHPHKDKEKEAE